MGDSSLRELRTENRVLRARLEELEASTSNSEKSFTNKTSKDYLYRELFEELRDAIFFTSQEGVIEDVNRAALNMFGRDWESLVGANFRDIYLEKSDASRFLYEIKKRLFVKDFEVKLKGAGGQAIDCLMTVSARRGPGGDILGYQGIIRDVTSRKMAQRRLVESEERFRSLSEQSPEIIYTLQEDGSISYVNPAWERILGHTPAEVMGRYFIDFAKPEDAGIYRNLFRRIRDERETFTDVDGELIAKDGTVKYFSLSGSPNVDASGRLLGMVGLFKDITARRRAEEELKLQKVYAEELIENLPEALVVLGNDDDIIKVNREFTRVFGYLPEEAYGKKINDLIVPDERKDEGQALTDRAAGGERLEVETKRRRKDGGLVDVSILATPIKTEHGQIGVYGIYRDISERKKTEELIKQNEEKYGAILENIEEGYYELNLKGHFIYATDVAAKIAGLPKEGFLGRNFSEFCDEEDAKALFEIYNKVYTSGRPASNVRYRVTLEDGTRKVLQASASLIRDAEGIPIGFRGIMSDITARFEAEEALKESEERHRTVLEVSPDPIIVRDSDRKISYINPSFTRVFGWTLDECRGKALDFVPKESLPETNEMIEKIERGKSFSGVETRRLTKDGRLVNVSISAAVFSDRSGRSLGSVITFQDITERKQAEEELNYVAYNDVLTGLPNRKSFYMKLEDMLLQSRRRSSDNTWALMFMDLDRFKHINDTLGHDIGDELLKKTADRIKECLRESDHVFRLGGDEFTIILTHVAQDLDVAKVAEKLMETVSRRCIIKGHELTTSASIGISVYPNDGQDVEVLVKNADMAMYAAKEGRNGYSFYTSDMNKKALERMKLESSLRSAIDDEQFVIHYQPLVDESNVILGMEALIRWQHPEMGLVPPVKFISLAEETGAIVRIGEWVLNTACKQVKQWHDIGYEGLYVAVNLSPRQFKGADLVPTVENALKESGLPPECLKLEITESSVMDDPEGAILKMQELKSKGIGFSMDDFGTGYSSLSYLKRFPIDTLKIDRSFVADSMDNRDDKEIIKTIIAMAQNLNITTVAEGVETFEQQDFLCSQGCTMMQGYFFGKPMPDEEFELLLQNQQRDPGCDK